MVGTMLQHNQISQKGKQDNMGRMSLYGQPFDWPGPTRRGRGNAVTEEHDKGPKRLRNNTGYNEVDLIILGINLTSQDQISMIMAMLQHNITINNPRNKGYKSIRALVQIKFPAFCCLPLCHKLRNRQKIKGRAHKEQLGYKDTTHQTRQPD
jgi:hypothetical protein